MTVLLIVWRACLCGVKEGVAGRIVRLVSWFVCRSVSQSVSQSVRGRRFVGSCDDLQGLYRFSGRLKFVSAVRRACRVVSAVNIFVIFILISSARTDEAR